MSITLNQLTKRYANHPVVNRVSLEIDDSEFFVLLGAKGSGKTTLLNLIAGITPIDSGSLLLNGHEVTQWPAHERGIGYIVQQMTAFEQLSVADNLAFGLRAHESTATEPQQRLDDLLALVGLTGLGSLLPSQVAGGCQRVALALALSQQPKHLLLDGFFMGLEAKPRAALQQLLKSLQQSLGLTIILATQDETDAFALADRLAVLSAGRVIEVGRPQTLYQQPETEYVATFLGTANLLVGVATRDSLHIGPHTFPLQARVSPLALDNARRVQVLFRPEDVRLAPTTTALAGPSLGEGTVEQITFAGAFERLQIRLPRLPGVRSIAPPVAYGGNALLIEALRTQAEASQSPLIIGQPVWVGINRLHTLTHPGLRVLVLIDSSPQAQAALRTAYAIAHQAQARLTLLGCGLTTEALLQQVQAIQAQSGGELVELESQVTTQTPTAALTCELERQAYDLVVLAGLADSTTLAEQSLQIGEHHVLVLPGTRPIPTQALICVAGGEPGKDDVLFTGRLIRHLDAKATLLSVLPDQENTPESHEWLRRFLQGGVDTLDLLGVPAQAVIRVGQARAEILAELAACPYGLLALGAPLPDRAGKIGLNGLVRELLATVTDRAILIIRSAM